MVFVCTVLLAIRYTVYTLYCHWIGQCWMVYCECLFIVTMWKEMFKRFVFCCKRATKWCMEVKTIHIATHSVDSLAKYLRISIFRRAVTLIVCIGLCERPMEVMVNLVIHEFVEWIKLIASDLFTEKHIKVHVDWVICQSTFTCVGPMFGDVMTMNPLSCNAFVPRNGHACGSRVQTAFTYHLHSNISRLTN